MNPVALQLRDQKNSIEEDTRKHCLICGQEANVFDRCVEGGFTKHIKETHNMWQYLYFMVYLDQKSDDEFTGAVFIMRFGWSFTVALSSLHAAISSVHMLSLYRSILSLHAVISWGMASVLVGS